MRIIKIQKLGGDLLKQTSLFVVLLLILQLVLPFSALANEQQTIIYTPLGDSLASGVNEKNELGKGYVDIIAAALQAEGKTVNYTKLYTCPGYTSINVLADFDNNITDTKCPYNTEPTNLTKLQERIAQSDLITISAGANDVLKNISFDAAGQPVIDFAGAQKSLNEVPKNYVSLLSQIRQLNPDAKIVVMGFYNPFPHLAQYKTIVDGLVADFDHSLATTIQQFGAKYAIVRDIIASNIATYLPNPENIHLSEAGYKVVGDAMYALLEEVVPEPSAPIFNDVASDSEWAKYIETVAKAGIMNGSNGNFQPAVPLKRIHVASMVTRMYGYEATSLAPFNDVANLNEKTRKELDAAYSNGIVRGSNNQFKPQDNVQRVQLASMLLRAYENKTGKTFTPTKSLPFTDTVNLSVEEQRAISFLYENNIVSGRTATTFAPRANTTRAAAAKIFAGILLMK